MREHNEKRDAVSSSPAVVRWQDLRMVYRTSGSFGPLLGSCGLGKCEIRSLSFLCPFFFVLLFFCNSFLSRYLSNCGLERHVFPSLIWSLFLGGLRLPESAEKWKTSMQLPALQAEGGNCCPPQMWKRLIPRHAMVLARPLQHHFLCEHDQWKVWSPWQRGGLIPNTWHWTCPAVIVNMHILLRTKLLLSFPHTVRNSPVHVSLSSTVNCCRICVFSSSLLMFCSSAHLTNVLCLSL